MNKNEYSCLIVSDFNADIFAAYLTNHDDFPSVNATVAPFGQVKQILMEENMKCWGRNPEIAVIWTQPQSVIESFNNILNYQNVSIDKVLNEVDEYSSLLVNLKNRVNLAFVPTWVLPSYHRGYGLIDMKNGLGMANLLMRMNLRLSENLAKTSNMYLLDTQRWIAIAGKNAFNPKLWYMGKIAFGNEVFKEALKDVKSALSSVSGNSKKMIMLDLDDTLWGGIVGEVGWENLKLGGHDPIGEAFVDFQKTLKAFTNRGILLGIVSKNEESIALEAINSHPEMVLKLDDFVGWKINWRDKAQNIVDLISELNLGLQSSVFIDDNPFERGRVREALPEIFVPEWPKDKMLCKHALLSLSCFDTPTVSIEDLSRTNMYVTERKRDRLKKNVGSLDEWLKSLDIKVKVQRLDEANLPRAAQLLNKTNQMNLTTRRMSESELMAWANERDHFLWTFRVGDKYGDSGLTGIIGVQINNTKARIVDFILSCRVIGRKVEETMLHIAIKYARSLGVDEVFAKYVETPKNRPCLDFWKSSGFAYDENNDTFYWNKSEEYPVPEQIEIQGDGQ